MTAEPKVGKVSLMYLWGVDMSVYQVEEYYVYIEFEYQLSEDDKETLKQAIEEEGYTSYEIADKSVTVDGIESEQEGLQLEELLSV